MPELLDEMLRNQQLAPADAQAFEAAAAADRDSWTEEQVLRWLAAEYDVAYADLSGVTPQPDALRSLPSRLLLRHELLPLRLSGGALEVAAARLFDTSGLDAAKMLAGKPIKVTLAPRAQIQRALRERLGVGADTLDTLDEERGLEIVEEEDGNVDLDQAAGDASIIRFVNQILTEAIAQRATDVHVEPYEDSLRIRYRIDGVLQEAPTPSQLKRYQPAIVSRVKILSGLDIAEKRLPQDGRIKVRLDKHDVDVRVSLIPMIHGEGVVLRLLQQEAALLGLKGLGMAAGDERVFRGLLGLPHGIVLVTGPTGSGKTTTLYSALNELNGAERKIITIEDPVEYHMKGVNQIQVSQKSGLTFARGLRSILRHDPDIVLVGEIRDSETAQIATQAALTGHLVFSTLHTNDAPGALVRLVDMGVEPYLVAASLEGVMAQRLVRVLCPACKALDPSAATRALAERMELLNGRSIYRAVGCEACRGTGFQGRHAIFEVMTVGEGIQEILLSTRSGAAVRAEARRTGLRTLSEDGWRLVAEGLTTPDEVLRVTKDEKAGAASGPASPASPQPDRALTDRG